MGRSVWGRKRRFPLPSELALLGFLALLAVGVGLARLQPAGPPLIGRAEAVDGDTLRVGSTRVRLLGLDAPELDQTCTRRDGAQWSCGREAKAVLANRLDAGPVECARYGHDAYGRILGRCSAGGADLGADLVRAGWAVSADGYLAEAAAARAQQLGIWSGSFDPPAVWRRSHGDEQPDLWDWIRSRFH